MTRIVHDQTIRRDRPRKATIHSKHIPDQRQAKDSTRVHQAALAYRILLAHPMALDRQDKTSRLSRAYLEP